PFKIDREAIDIAIEISLLAKLNIVGEVHITRKQYLDGSIPTGFQRTAILGVEGTLPLKNKNVRIMQLSVEEDSCREISDIGHVRIYKTDRLGMPLVEIVTYPDCFKPDEVKEAADYIRFLSRSTNKVRTGIGSTRADVNVSCRGGTRVEIKGVSHNRWMPKLTHNECFRQWALLNIREILRNRVPDYKNWKASYVSLNYEDFEITYEPLKIAKEQKLNFIAINLPEFKGILSHFTQPGKMFADELTDRLKVIACLEKPNMLHTEQFDKIINDNDMKIIAPLLNIGGNDAQVVIWCSDYDKKTAIETIEERCKLAFECVPNETRKSYENGTTIFERVLPGPDRMYPDTDSVPIPLTDEYINKLKKNLPVDVIDRIHQLNRWCIPEDTYRYILKKNLVPLIERIINDLKLDSRFAGTFFGHRLRHLEGHIIAAKDFNYDMLYDLFKYLRDENLDVEIAKQMLPVLYEHPKMDFESVLTNLKFRRRTKEQLVAPIGFLKEKYKEIGRNKSAKTENDWVMGQIRKQAVGNLSLKELKINIDKWNT
ncbi:MAG: Glu-tRNA(Gln) amidotransferase GatDE subunit E, partial [Bacteroidia bacterium]|nr:Glu-tRNA(Gln) amidotransferase GatDE subunit E [Bacteroidia bacterium]